MMAGRGTGDGAAGGPTRHIPVLLDEVLRGLALPPGGVCLDGTFGAGGYSRALLQSDPTVRVLALDRDPDAIAAGYGLVAASGGRLTLVEARFSQLDREAAAARLPSIDAIMLDIGVSSMQLDQAERGFSFRADGPLDMRMAQSGESAADLVNTAEEGRLADILYRYGEERQSRAIAKAIVSARAKGRIATTSDLAAIVCEVIWPRPDRIHPATRTFQALRIAVNDELGELVAALYAAERVLKPGGRLAIVTFHSLEDRIVKQFFAQRAGKARGSRFQPEFEAAPATFIVDRPSPVTPGEPEIDANPRARSAKLRIATRTDAAALPGLPDLDALAALPPSPRGKR